MRKRWVIAVLLAIGTGCGGTTDSADPGGTHDHGGSAGQDASPDTDPGAAGADTAGGSARGGEGGTNAGGAGTGGDAGYDDSVGGYPDALITGIPDFGNCVADLTGGHGDAISVHGHAGVLGDVDYTIWGSSAGMGRDDGMERQTYSGSGQKGTPSGISATRLATWTHAGDLIEGQIYERNPAQLDFRIEANGLTTSVECMDATASGSFAFIRFDHPTTDGVYEIDCPASDIQVHGCFHYAF
ncbi:MAG TPA: hypothetical protein VGJ91_00805 [Polyangiaceae bacterium]|jgi:hypothetical protein